LPSASGGSILVSASANKTLYDEIDDNTLEKNESSRVINGSHILKELELEDEDIQEESKQSDTAANSHVL